MNLDIYFLRLRYKFLVEYQQRKQALLEALQHDARNDNRNALAYWRGFDVECDGLEARFFLIKPDEMRTKATIHARLKQSHAAVLCDLHMSSREVHQCSKEFGQLLRDFDRQIIQEDANALKLFSETYQLDVINSPDRIISRFKESCASALDVNLRQ